LTSEQKNSANTEIEKNTVEKTLLPENKPEGWDIIEVGELIDRVRSRVDPEEMTNQNYISLKHMGKGEPRINQKEDAKGVSSQKYAFEKNDILFGKLRPYFRKVALAKFDGICSTDINVIKPTEIVGRDFLFYTLFRQDFIDVADKTSTGTRMPRADWSKLTDMKVALPPLEEQKKISSVLYILDEKIETNNHINEILEEIAQTLFKSWFVEFEPYEDFKDSEIGKIPETFEIKTIDEITENYDRKRDPVKEKVRKENDDIYPYYGAVRPLGYMDEYIFDGKYLLVAEDGTNSFPEGYPVTQFVNERFWASNHVHVIKGDGRVTTEFLKWLLANTNVKPYLTGSVQPKLNQGNFNSIKVAIPTQDEIQRFTQLVKPVHRLIWQHKEESEKLSSARDTLLPKLMSGEIRVNDIELDELEVDSEV
jgi:type I restriction enzyme S subunit